MEIDPEAPSIWFSTASSRAAAADSLSSLASGATGAGSAHAGEEGGEGEESAPAAGGHPAGEEEAGLAGVSPFAAAGQAAAGAEAEHGAEQQAAAAEAGAGVGPPAPAPPGPSEPIPPADEAAAAAVAELAAAAAAAAAVEHGSPRQRTRKAASAAGASSVAGTSVAGGSVASSRLQLDKQLTLKYPTVITPSGAGGCGWAGAGAGLVGDGWRAARPALLPPGSFCHPMLHARCLLLASTPSSPVSLPPPAEHVDEFRGPLPAEALADLYAGGGWGGSASPACLAAGAHMPTLLLQAGGPPCPARPACHWPTQCTSALRPGRHERVPAGALHEALHFLKYSYAVYSLQPKSGRGG